MYIVFLYKAISSKKRLFLTFLTIWISTIYLHGQDHPYIVEVERIDSKAGLLGQRVLYSYEDKRGILWAITTEGLNRYDGRNIKWYKEFFALDYFNTDYEIYEDHDGFLWVINLFGVNVVPHLYIINSHTGQIFNFDSKIKPPFQWDDVLHIRQGENGNIYLSTKSNEIFVYSGNNEFSKLESIDFKSPFQIINVNKEGDSWLKTINPNQLIRIKNNGQVSFFDLEKLINTNLNSSFQFISKTEDNYSLFFQYDNRFSYFISISDFDSISVQKFTPNTDLPFSIIKKYSFPISSIGSNKKNNSVDYLFPLQGFKLYSSSGEILYDFQQQHPEVQIGPPQERKYFFISKPWLFFVNTPKGLFKFHLNKNRFEQHLDTSCRKILNSSNGIIVNDYSKLWRQNTTTISPKNKKGFFHDFVKDSQGNYWTWDGYDLDLFSPNFEIIKSFSIIPRLIPGHAFGFTIFEVDEDKIFIGGINRQLLYSKKSDKVTNLKIDIPDYKEGDQLLIYNFQEDKQNNLWTSSNRGLLLTDFKSGQISSVWVKDSGTIQLPTSAVHHLYQDSVGIFWLAGKNLTRWNSVTNESKIYTSYDGLPSSILHAVYPDDFGNLWISTENGISCFNIKNEKFRNYSTSDGITHNEFNRMSHFQDKDGTIYFGGISGINIFHPKDFQYTNRQSNQSEILIMDFEQYSGIDNKVINKLESLFENKKIVLEPNDRFFRIHFTIPDYTHNRFINYEYKITGHEENWVALNENQLRISGLPYGTFDLKIKAKPESGQYVTKELNIPILVLRPFYLQFWFIILSGIIIGGAIFTFYKIRIRRLENQKIALQQLVDQRTQTIQNQKIALENSNAFKDRLFAIIAHDMRNAIYSFNGITDTIKTFIRFDQPEKILNMSDAIDKSSSKLSHLLDNLLEWALSQRGESTYRPELIQINSIIKDSISPFEDRLITNSILVKFDTTHDTFIYADRGAIETIFRNVIHNAVKYTPPKGMITLHVKSDEKYNTIIIKDTGIGMDKKTLSSLFDTSPKISQKGLNGQHGSGIGLLLVKELVELNKGKIKVESTPNKGTTFYLSFLKESEKNETPSISNKEGVKV